MGIIGDRSTYKKICHNSGRICRQTSKDIEHKTCKKYSQILSYIIIQSILTCGATGKGDNCKSRGGLVRIMYVQICHHCLVCVFLGRKCERRRKARQYKLSIRRENNITS